MKVLLIGAGGVGVYFCSMLARAGAEVTVVARSEYETVRANGGYRVEAPREKYFFTPARLLNSAAEYRETADFVILATKVLDGVNQAELLRPAINSAGTVIVQIQNGIDIEREIAETFPENELVSAVAYIGVARPKPGLIGVQSAGRLKIGTYPRGIGAGARKLAETFESVGIECKTFDEIGFYRWEKLAWNLPFNPVSILAGGVDTRTICDDNELEPLCVALMDEVIAVANSEGYALTHEAADNQMNYTRHFPAYRTSMLQDLDNHRPLELEAILGNALRIARRNGVPTPRIATCYALLRSIERTRKSAKRQ